MWVRIFSAAILGAAFLAGCNKGESTATSRPSGASAASAAARITLALNWKPEAEFGGFYQAQADGDFAKHGLDVDLVPGGSGTPTIQMVDSGQVPFGIVSGDELLIGRSRNHMTVVALFAVYQTNPQGIMTHAAKGYKSLADLLNGGGTLAIQRGLPYADFLEQKYSFKNVKIVPDTGGIAEFLHDPNFSQQCFITSEPLAAKQAGSDPQTFLIADAGYNPYTTVLVTRADYLQSHAQQVKDLVAAVTEGWTAYLKDPSTANAAMQKLNPTMDAKTLADSAAAQKPLIETAETQANGLGTMTAARWDELGKQLVQLKAIDTAPKAEECFVNPGK